jgi:hypothetical protein
MQNAHPPDYPMWNARKNQLNGQANLDTAVVTKASPLLVSRRARLETRDIGVGTPIPL